MVERVGQQLGNYRLIRLLGRGGFADVYLGEHIYLKTLAAIKLLQVRLVNEDLQSFLTEARIIAGLDHPHIVHVLDFGVEESTPFLVMGYAPNGTLRERYLRGTHVPPVHVVSYVKQAADALQYAHDRRLIHRDVKPENMLLGAKQEILLSDFGIALATQSSRYESTKEIVGTTAYMAPEQLQGKPRPATDQYALGIIVYEWLSGDKPFHGSFFELYSQHMFVPPPPLREKVPTISPAIEHVVLTALAKDPQQRFPTIQAFAAALEQSCRGTTPHQVGSFDTYTMPTQPMPIAVVTPPLQIPLLFPATISAGQTPIPLFATHPAAGETPLPFSPEPLPHEVQQPQKSLSRRKALAVMVGVTAAGVAASSLALLANLRGAPVTPIVNTNTATANASGTPGQHGTVTAHGAPGHRATATHGHTTTATPVGTPKPGVTPRSDPTSTSGVTPRSDPTPTPEPTSGGQWSSTGNLLLARSRFRATTLQTGVVLVEGGVLATGGYTAESEVFNPSTGAWFQSGNLNQVRSGHTATLLSNGKVLVTGGYTGSTLASSEWYDPTTGVWKVTGNMSQPRTRHSATLVNGLVLVCGGWNNGNMTASCELFNPATGTWSLASNMATIRADHLAVLLPNGKILVAGGAPTNNNFTTEAELYNPSTNTWTVTGSMNVPRSDFSLVLLSNGQVLALGGATPNGQTTTTELYNPATGNWSMTGSMHNPRSGLRDQSAVLLANGTVLVAGGDAVLGTSEVYNPTTEAWNAPLNMNEPHCDGATAYLGGGRILAVGGYNCASLNNKLAATEIYT